MRHGYKNKSPDKRKEKEQEDAENLRQKKWAVSLLYENGVNSIKKYKCTLQVGLLFLQIHTNLNPLKVFTSSR